MIALDETNLTAVDTGQTETIRPVMGGLVSPPDALTGTAPPERAPGSSGVTHIERPHLRWYAVQHHAFLGGFARRSIIEQGFRVHWPREVVRRRRQDDILQPLFQPYLFVQFDITKPWANVQHSGGVVTILGLKEFGAPIAAPVGEVEKLIRRAGGKDDGWIDNTDDAKFHRSSDIHAEGEELTFLDEALFGHKVVVKLDRGRQCLDAMMKMFGMERRVRVSRDRVKREGG